MDYGKHYNLLISRCVNRIKPIGYVERHHIVPICVDGSDEPYNLVYLTAREHYVAHELLARIYGGLAWSAAFYMGNRTSKQSSRLHAKAREEHSKLQSTVGSRVYAEGKGIAALTKDQRIEASRLGGNLATVYGLGSHRRGGYSNNGKATYAKKVGIFSASSELKKEWGNLGGTKARAMKLGIHASGMQSKGGVTTKAKGVGIFSLDKEERSKWGKIGGSRGAANTNTQRWKCEVCGFESTAAGVTSHHKGSSHAGKIKI